MKRYEVLSSAFVKGVTKTGKDMCNFYHTPYFLTEEEAQTALTAIQKAKPKAFAFIQITPDISKANWSPPGL